jgi:phosphate transport system permease protein
VATLEATPGRVGSGLRKRRSATSIRELPIHAFLFACAVLTVVTTLGIVVVLFEETIAFFGEVSAIDFFTDTQWTPLFTDKHFGVLPLLNATMLMAVLSMLMALPLGLAVAIYLSEYAPQRLRSIVKPVLELLAGVPTVVYGYFAIQFISPHIVQFFFGEDTSLFNALSASIAMGIMMLPLISSLSEDALRAVPQALREGAYGLGANRFEVATKVVLPAALSGVVAASILAVSRAVGETMIVTLAAGQIPNLSWNPLESMEAMTAYIVQVSLGDTPRGTIEYSTIFAIGSTLFVSTLLLNVFAQWLLAKFREAYD